MAPPIRKALSNPCSEASNLVSSITSVLRALNPQNAKPSAIKSQPLQEFSYHLNPQLVTETIKAQSNPYHALFFFNWASNPDHNPKSYSHTHCCYSAITDLLLSHSLFCTAYSLLQNSHRLSPFMLGKFIKASGDRGDIRGAIHWFQLAKSCRRGRGLFYPYNVMLSVLVRANRWKLLMGFYNEIINEGVVEPDVYTYTIMIRGFCKTNMIDNAKKMFDQMRCKPNLITYNTMIHGLCKKGDMEAARSILTGMSESEDCFPDVVTYTTMIDGYCKKGEINEAAECFNEMVRLGFSPNEFTYNALVEGLCVSGNMDDAKSKVVEMRLNGFKDSIVTNTSILKGYCNSGKCDEGVKHMKEMITRGIRPDAKSYCVLVYGFCKMRRLDEAISLIKEMTVRGIYPSACTFNVVIRSLVKNDELDRAVFLLREMLYMSCSPNFLSYSIVICSLCKVKGRMQEVEELVGEMIQNGHNLDASMFSSLVRGYCADGNEDVALRTFWEAIEKKYVISLDVFSIFVEWLSIKRKFREVETIFEHMCRQCPIFDANSYRMVLARFANK